MKSNTGLNQETLNMLRPLNFNTHKRKLWITSDTHFNHDKEFVWKARGFESMRDHDSQIQARWNKIVGDDDDVLHLGDFVCNDGQGIRTYDLIANLNGHIHLLWGNHNSGVKTLYRQKMSTDFNTDKFEVYPLTYADKLTFLGDSAKGYINNVAFVASHFAYRIWEEMQHGAICLSGHSHGSDKESLRDWLECKRLDVGIDNFGQPISFEEIMDIMASKKVPVIDHHDKQTVSAIG